MHYITSAIIISLIFLISYLIIDYSMHSLFGFRSSDLDIFNCNSEFISDKKFITPPCDNPWEHHHMMLGYLSLPFQYSGKMIGKIIDETDGLIPDCHFGEHGHRVQSEYFYEHIIKNII